MPFKKVNVAEEIKQRMLNDEDFKGAYLVKEFGDIVAIEKPTNDEYEILAEENGL